jgi:hypothetical protein
LAIILESIIELHILDTIFNIWPRSISFREKGENFKNLLANDDEFPRHALATTMNSLVLSYAENHDYEYPRRGCLEKATTRNLHD